MAASLCWAGLERAGRGASLWVWEEARAVTSGHLVCRVLGWWHSHRQRRPGQARPDIAPHQLKWSIKTDGKTQLTLTLQLSRGLVGWLKLKSSEDEVIFKSSWRFVNWKSPVPQQTDDLWRRSFVWLKLGGALKNLLSQNVLCYESLSSCSQMNQKRETSGELLKGKLLKFHGDLISSQLYKSKHKRAHSRK